MAVHLLDVQPDGASDLGPGEARLGESSIRPAARILGALLALNVARFGPVGQRVVGTCRHFALLSCALRYRGSRPGFATYFQAGQNLDHWSCGMTLTSADVGPWARPVGVWNQWPYDARIRSAHGRIGLMGQYAGWSFERLFAEKNACIQANQNFRRQLDQLDWSDREGRDSINEALDRNERTIAAVEAEIEERRGR